MKLIIPRSELKEALAGLSKVVNLRAPVPILSSLRLDAEDQSVRLTGTSIDQTATYTITVADPMPSPVSVLVPLAELQTAMRTAQGPNILIESGKDAVTVTATVAGQGIGRRIETPGIADWPVLPDAVETKPVEPGFLAGLRQALAFASTDDNRPLLKSVLLDVDAKAGHRLVSTDSRRLTVLPCGILPLAESVIVPSCRFLNWSRLEGSAQIGAGKGVFTLRCGPWVYTTKVVEGQYPRWSQVVPSYDDARTLELSPEDTELLIKALPSLPTYEGSLDAVVLCLEPDGARIYSRPDAKAPESAIRMEKSKHSGGGAFAIGLNREFFRDALIAGFRIWEMRDPTSPLLGRITKDDKGSVHVLMPIRTIDHEVPRTEAPAAEAKPTPIPVQPQPMKEATMPKKPEQPQTVAPEAPTSLDRILSAYELAKDAVRQANTALADVAQCVREAIKDDRARRKEIADVRAGLARLQAIRV